MLRSAQLTMALVAATSSLVPISNLAMQRHPSVGGIAVSVTSAVFTVLMTWFWLTRWPTRWQSECTALAGAVFVAAWSVVQTSPGVASLACSALAVTGGYLAFFHNPRSLAFNVVIALATAAYAAWRLSLETDIATAAAAFWLAWFLNVSAPVTVRGLSRALSVYANRADKDTLTGLLNRQGFIDAVIQMLAEPPPAPAKLAVIMLDIDNFKRINDTFGHPAGDRVILAVADLLRHNTPTSAALCRSGGEEFLVALMSSSSPLPIAHDVCAAITRLDDGITASVGIAVAEYSEVRGPNVTAAVAQLIADADSAMYRIKRSGGNGVWHTPPQRSARR